MAIKLTLQPKPTFKAKVPIYVPGGNTAFVEFVFKHFPEDERYAMDVEMREADDAIRDEMGIPKDLRTAATKGKVDAEKFAKYLRKLREMQPEKITRIASGWDLDEPFNEENVAVLLNNYDSAFDAIMETYRSELSGAKEKN